MVEVFGIQVNLEFVASNLKEIKRKVNDELGKVATRIGGPAREAYSAATGIAGSFKAGGPALGALAGMGAVVAILKKIHNRIEKMVDKLGEASAAFKSMNELTDKIWNIALRPMANIMAVLMKPYLIMAMQLIRPKIMQIYEILKKSQATGGVPSAEDMEEIQSIWEEMATLLGGTFMKMNELIKPMAAEIDAFLLALKAQFASLTPQLGAYIAAFIKQIFGPDPTEEYVKLLMEALEEGTIQFDQIPKNIQEWIKGFNEKAVELDKKIKETLPYFDYKKEYDQVKGSLIDFSGAIDNAVTWIKDKLGLITSADVIRAIETGKYPGVGEVTIKDIESGIELEEPDEYFRFGKQTGGDISDTGMYMLHRGEKVIPAGRANETNKSTILKPTFNFNGPINKDIDIDSLMRRASRQSELNLRRFVMFT